jgi:Ca2+-transporting ATPase
MKKPPRSADDELITPWVFFRYMVVGLYVGFATVGVFAYWYVLYDWSEYQQPLIKYSHLSHFSKCNAEDMTEFNTLYPGYAPNFDAWVAEGGQDYSDNVCAYMTKGKTTASTLSLSVLVTIEMFNALNALSEDGSLVQMPPWANPWLLVAMLISFGLHFVILYVPVLATVFSIEPLTYNDWMLVLGASFPVILIDEVLKFFGRRFQAKELAKRIADAKKNE